jgi:two-component system, cell cycle response regulator
MTMPMATLVSRDRPTLAMRAVPAGLAGLALCGAGTLAAAATFAFEDAQALRRWILLGCIVVAGLLVVVLFWARGDATPAERPAWRAVAVAMLLAAIGNAAAGPALLDATVAPPLYVSALGVCCYAVAVRGFFLLVRARLGSLRHSTWLDGLLAALVTATLLTWALLGPTGERIGGDDLVAFALPVADALLLGLFLAAAAQGGWRFAGWTPFIAGAALLTLYDCTFAAEALGTAPAALEAMHLAWPVAYLCFGLGSRSRAARPKPYPLAQAAVPVGAGAVAVVVLGTGAVLPGVVPAVTVAFALAATAVGLGRFAATLIENQRMVADARSHALTDALTGLANRRQLMSDLDHALAVARGDRLRALAIFDLDGFKRYNDTFGHQAGDELLAAAAVRMAEAAAWHGTAYRLGGDEFCLLIERCSDRVDAERVAELAAAALSTHRTGFPVRASYGLVLVPSEAQSADEALRLADQRMYRHKASKPEGPPGHAAAAAPAVTGSLRTTR